MFGLGLGLLSGGMRSQNMGGGLLPGIAAAEQAALRQKLTNSVVLSRTNRPVW
jgi:hypothetical protein